MNEKILKRLKELEASEGVEIVYLTLFGSHLYGTASEKSDVDIKGVFIYPPRAAWYGEVKDHYTFSTGDDVSKNSNDDVDVELYSLQKFLKLLQKGETGALDLLFSSMRLDTRISHGESNWMSLLMRKNAHLFATKKIHAFVGYCQNQAKKYGAKGTRYGEVKAIYKFLKENLIPEGKVGEIVEKNSKFFTGFEHCLTVTKDGQRFYSILGKLYSYTITQKEFISHVKAIKDTYGHRAKAALENVDWKALSHAFRVIYEAEQLMLTRTIEFPLRNASFLKSIKSGEIPINDLLSELEVALDRTKKAVDESSLPDEVPSEVVREFLKVGYDHSTQINLLPKKEI